MEISIIIPIYNAEKYMDRCLKSVIESLKGTSGEVLLIDNDSSDNSLATAKKWQKKYSKLIRVLQCHTPGAAAVRNEGAKKARGKFIWFIDADDYIAKNAVQKLTEKANSTEADMVMMGAERLDKNGAKSYLSAVRAGQPDTKSRFVRYGMGPWQVLIRRNWWKEHGFLFKEGIIQEDMELMSSLILYTEKFASIDEALYFYCNTPESVLHKSEFSPHIFDIFPALEGLYARFKEAGAEKQFHDELEWFFIWNLLLDSAKDFGAFPEGRPGFARSRRMLDKYFPAWRKNRFFKQKPLKLRLRIRLNYARIK